MLKKTVRTCLGVMMVSFTVLIVYSCVVAMLHK